MVLATLCLFVLAAAQEDPAEDIKAAELDMSAFEASDLVTFELPAKGQTEFFQSIEVVPQMVNVLYLVSSKETNDIDMIVRGPGNKVVKQMLKKKDASFRFRADVAGDYNFLFINRKYMEKLAVTFAMHVGEPEKALRHDDITPVESNLIDMHRQLSQLQMEQHISDRRQEAHFKTVASANSKVLWFSLAECLGVVGLSVWQVYYIKQLLSNRRVL